MMPNVLVAKVQSINRSWINVTTRHQPYLLVLFVCSETAVELMTFEKRRLNSAVTDIKFASELLTDQDAAEIMSAVLACIPDSDPSQSNKMHDNMSQRDFLFKCVYTLMADPRRSKISIFTKSTEHKRRIREAFTNANYQLSRPGEFELQCIRFLASKGLNTRSNQGAYVLSPNHHFDQSKAI
jgi:hypothetical protein